MRVPLKRDAARSVLPDGVYELMIKEVEDKVGKESGIPYMNLTLTVRKNGRPVGGSVWDIISMSDNAAFKLAQFLDAVEAEESGDVSSQWFKGKKAWATLSTDTYNGTVKNVVKSYLTPDQAEDILSKQGDMGDDLDSVATDDFDDEPAPKTRRGRKAQVEVEDMEEEEMPL